MQKKNSVGLNGKKLLQKRWECRDAFNDLHDPKFVSNPAPSVWGNWRWVSFLVSGRWGGTLGSFRGGGGTAGPAGWGGSGGREPTSGGHRRFPCVRGAKGRHAFMPILQFSLYSPLVVVLASLGQGGASL